MTEPTRPGPSRPPSQQPSKVPAPARCLNCGAPLHGMFCGACGQRVVPPYPTLGEMVGDAWEELSGYDGRFLRTVRLLLRRPGALTLEVLEGRRARYVSPVRLYLAASLLFFLVGAFVPSVRRPQPVIIPGSNYSFDLMAADSDGFAALAPGEQARVLSRVERAPWGLRHVLKAALLHPVDLRTRFLAALPRVLFFLVPVFAGVVALFYWRRMSQHLVFALHLHTTIFLVFAAQRLSNLTGILAIAQATTIIALVLLGGYGLAAFRRVYGGSWPSILVKSVCIVAIYLGVGLATLLATFAWAAVT